MRVERIASSRSAPEVLRRVAAATTRLGLPPPAALTGDWFGSRAVIAPSVAVEPVAAADVFDVGTGSTGAGDAVGGGWIGYLSYPDAGARRRGPTDSRGRRRLDRRRAAPGSRRNLVVRKPFRRSSSRRGWPTR